MPASVIGFTAASAARRRGPVGVARSRGLGDITGSSDVPELRAENAEKKFKIAIVVGVLASAAALAAGYHAGKKRRGR